MKRKEIPYPITNIDTIRNANNRFPDLRSESRVCVCVCVQGGDRWELACPRHQLGRACSGVHRQRRPERTAPLWARKGARSTFAATTVRGALILSLSLAPTLSLTDGPLYQSVPRFCSLHRPPITSVTGAPALYRPPSLRPLYEICRRGISR